jgi:PAS domain S-box-containing protein
MTDTVDAGMFEAWLASTDDGAIGIDASGRVLLHNPAASRVTGLAPAEGRSLPWRDVLRLEPAIADLLWGVRSTGRPVRALTDVLCAQGNLRTTEVSARPWTDAAGAVGILVVIRDAGVLCRQGTGPGGRPGYGSLVGSDPAMEAMYQLVDAVAPSDAPVVIEGESGVGKEVVAQLLHARRPSSSARCGLGRGSDVSSWLTPARFFSNRSIGFLGRFRRDCCICFRPGKLSAEGTPGPGWWTFG